MKFILCTLPLVLLLSCGPKKFTPTDNMIEVKASDQNIALKKGDIIYYQAEEHGSTGLRVDLKIENTEILQLVKIHEDYDNRDWEKTAGGDRATKTFVMKALKEGGSQFTVKKMFRGDLENQHIITCSVKE